jgi:hopanoid biosynthesis associated protein HpnK
MTAKRLIVTADDFGLALPVNEAVEQAHRFGILSAASLMVTAPAADDAVRRARRLPGLGVGLHLVLVDGRPALPREAVSELVGPDGRFGGDPWRMGVRIYCREAARRQAEAEIRAQLTAFARTGLPLDHVNGHHHFHLHPTVQEVLVKLAPEFGIRAVRVPREPPLLAWRATGHGLARRLGVWLFQARLTSRMRQRLHAAGIGTNDWLLGLGDSGHMRAERLRGYLANLPDGVSELYFHAAVARWPGREAWPSDYESRCEFEALVDPAVLAMARGAGIETGSFAALAAHRA